MAVGRVPLASPKTVLAATGQVIETPKSISRLEVTSIPRTDGFETRAASSG
jgi:hypothetical protein